ncbi:hypothetical protein ABPG74_002539 [Tetrahymena malaccensis]
MLYIKIKELINQQRNQTNENKLNNRGNKQFPPINKQSLKKQEAKQKKREKKLQRKLNKQIQKRIQQEKQYNNKNYIDVNNNQKSEYCDLEYNNEANMNNNQIQNDEFTKQIIGKYQQKTENECQQSEIITPYSQEINNQSLKNEHFSSKKKESRGNEVITQQSQEFTQIHSEKANSYLNLLVKMNLIYDGDECSSLQQDAYIEQSTHKDKKRELEKE